VGGAIPEVEKLQGRRQKKKGIKKKKRTKTKMVWCGGVGVVKKKGGTGDGW